MTTKVRLPSISAIVKSRRCPLHAAVGEKEQQHSYQLVRRQSSLGIEPGFINFQWVVEGNDSDGYTIQNDLTKRYLGVNGDNVILSEDTSLWLFVRLEGQQYFKFVYAVFVFYLYSILHCCIVRIQLKGDHDSRVATLTGPSDFDPIVLGNYTGESNELWYPLKR